MTYYSKFPIESKWSLVALIAQLVVHLANDCKKVGFNLGSAQHFKKWTEKNKIKYSSFLMRHCHLIIF
jgi:hypothetical protein